MQPEPRQLRRSPLCRKPRRLSILHVTALALLSTAPILAAAQAPPVNQPAAQPLNQSQAQSLVKQVLRAELEASTDTTHPMQYRLHKSSPRYATTKLIIETRDGDVAHLVAINGGPLGRDDRAREQARLDGLLNDPSLQEHRQQREQEDTQRARKIMRALADAFLYSYAGTVDTPQGPSYRLTFQPNSEFDPRDIESQALKEMAGELWIDVAQHRVTRLEGKRLRDVDYGFGVLGKLNKGGTLLLEQADVGNHQWRTTHLVLIMDARVIFKTIKLDTTLELSQYRPVARNLDYRQAIQMLRHAAEADKPGQ